MKKGVLRPGHIQLRVLNMAQALEHYINLLGLIETDRDEQGRVYLKAWTEVEKFSVVLVEADEPGMDFMAYKVIDEATLECLEADLLAYGCTVRRMPAGDLKGCGRRVQFDLPSGHVFELYADKDYTGKWGVSDFNPEAWPRGLKGMRAVRFDHCLLYGGELQATYDLLVDVLGFYLAEQVVDDQGTRIAQFMSLATKAHDVAFIQHAEPGRLHHVSFYLETWEDVLRAADLISMTNSSLDIGPTRHGLTHGKTVYFFDPSGNRNEVFAGGDYNYPDHKPQTWSADELGKAIFYHDRALNERFLTVLT